MTVEFAAKVEFEFKVTAEFAARAKFKFEMTVDAQWQTLTRARH
jgi:precorrin-4 methylase